MIRRRRFLASSGFLLLAAVLVAPGARGAVVTANVAVVATRVSGNPAHPGEVIGYHFTVSNAGPTPASNVVLTDVIPTHTTFDEGGAVSGWVCSTPGAGGTGTFQCTLATLASGATAPPLDLEINVLDASVTPIVDTATVSSDDPDPDESDNSSTVSTDVASIPIPTVPMLSAGILAGLGAAVAVAGLLFLRR